MMYPRKWEKITEHTRRLKVFGGWLVQTTASWGMSEGVSISVAMCFVFDPFRMWQLSKEEK
jgi:hypothetical protein